MAALVALVLTLAGAPAARATATPIKHFVLLMQQNHSFDNYFGTFPGADGIRPDTCIPIRRGPRPCARPFHLRGSVPDLAHGDRVQRMQVAGGRMDGFIRAASADRQTVDRSVMGYYDDRELPFYWNVAREYVLFDRFFAAARSGSLAGFPALFDRLQRRGIRWQLYREDVNLGEYYRDLQRGTLPAVAYIVPAGSSEHPPGRIEAGQRLVRSLLTALARSDAWDSSAFLWTYDEPGGWFDHVRPPRGMGLRVPALLVSPYARQGLIDSTPLDTSSIPAFIERNWELRARAGRSFESAFDFAAPPREPSIPSGERRSDRRMQHRIWVIYLGYGAALALVAVVVGRVGLAAAAVALLALVAAPAPALGAPAIQTVPKLPGMRFSLDGVPFEADASGTAQPPTAGGLPRALTTRLGPGVRARLDRWYDGGRVAALVLEYRVGLRFIDLRGSRVDPAAVKSVTLSGTNGRRVMLRGAQPRWLEGNRVVPESGGRRSVAVSYAADKVVVGGSSVVHRGQQRFYPDEVRRPKLRLLLFAARVEVRDALLGFPIGSTVRLEYPDGAVRRAALGSGGNLTLESLPRGDYRVGVDALGVSSTRPVALSGDQRIQLQVISWLDIAIVALGLLSLALALRFIRRPAAVAVVAVGAALLFPSPPAVAERADPLYAYYYIWFNPSSWDRAKTDYPLLGRYSSDDRGVMDRHVRWARRAGIDGFIVSWKSTPVLDRRLARLAEVADAHDFKLLVIYQGLDFEREPLPAAGIARDLDRFRSRFAADRAFHVFDRPVVIWSGTPRFSRSDLRRVTGSRRDALRILASERNVAGYRRVAPYVDGNAYYWASVNPRTYPGQASKLAEMGRAVHARGGLWIPSAAPGFDARKVGGSSVVERRGGATLRAEMAAAARSTPDAIGLISWNEFSENTHVEPSRTYGSRYLEQLADLRGARLTELRDFDSSEPAPTDVNYGVPLLGGVAILVVGGAVAFLAARRRFLTLRR